MIRTPATTPRWPASSKREPERTIATRPRRPRPIAIRKPSRRRKRRMPKRTTTRRPTRPKSGIAMARPRNVEPLVAGADVGVRELAREDQDRRRRGEAREDLARARPAPGPSAPDADRSCSRSRSSAEGPIALAAGEAREDRRGEALARSLDRPVGAATRKTLPLVNSTRRSVPSRAIAISTGPVPTPGTRRSPDTTQDARAPCRASHAGASRPSRR